MTLWLLVAASPLWGKPSMGIPIAGAPSLSVPMTSVLKGALLRVLRTVLASQQPGQSSVGVATIAGNGTLNILVDPSVGPLEGAASVRKLPPSLTGSAPSAEAILRGCHELKGQPTVIIAWDCPDVGKAAAEPALTHSLHWLGLSTDLSSSSCTALCELPRLEAISSAIDIAQSPLTLRGASKGEVMHWRSCRDALETALLVLVTGLTGSRVVVVAPAGATRRSKSASKTKLDESVSVGVAAVLVGGASTGRCARRGEAWESLAAASPEDVMRSDDAPHLVAFDSGQVGVVRVWVELVSEAPVSLSREDDRLHARPGGVSWRDLPPSETVSYACLENPESVSLSEMGGLVVPVDRAPSFCAFAWHTTEGASFAVTRLEDGKVRAHILRRVVSPVDDSIHLKIRVRVSGARATIVSPPVHEALPPPTQAVALGALSLTCASVFHRGVLGGRESLRVSALSRIISASILPSQWLLQPHGHPHRATDPPPPIELPNGVVVGGRIRPLSAKALASSWEALSKPRPFLTRLSEDYASMFRIHGPHGAISKPRAFPSLSLLTGGVRCGSAIVPLWIERLTRRCPLFHSDCPVMGIHDGELAVAGLVQSPPPTATVADLLSVAQPTEPKVEAVPTKVAPVKKPKKRARTPPIELEEPVVVEIGAGRRPRRAAAIASDAAVQKAVGPEDHGTRDLDDHSVSSASRRSESSEFSDVPPSDDDDDDDDEFLDKKPDRPAKRTKTTRPSPESKKPKVVLVEPRPREGSSALPWPFLPDTKPLIARATTFHREASRLLSVLVRPRLQKRDAEAGIRLITSALESLAGATPEDRRLLWARLVDISREFDGSSPLHREVFLHLLLQGADRVGTDPEFAVGCPPEVRRGSDGGVVSEGGSTDDVGSRLPGSGRVLPKREVTPSAVVEARGGGRVRVPQPWADEMSDTVSSSKGFARSSSSTSQGLVGIGAGAGNPPPRRPDPVSLTVPDTRLIAVM
jgi:hypothetical protein